MDLSEPESRIGWYLLYSVLSLIAGIILQGLYAFRTRRYPKGPIGVPLLGYLPFLGKEPHRDFAELSKKYGKAVSLYFGPSYTVIINDYDLAKDILSHPATIARPDKVFDFVPGKGGFAGKRGDDWQEQRRFCMQAMKNLGLGRGPWESMIQDDMNEFLNELSSFGGKPTEILDYLTRCGVSNNLALLLGRRLPKKESNPEVQNILDAHHVMVKAFAVSSPNTVAPWITKYLVMFRISGYHKKAMILKRFADILRKEIDRHMVSEELSDKSDLIGLYLAEMKRQEGSGKKHYFSVDNLLGDMVVLFFAGSDTTITSMHWLLLLMAAHPHVQKKVQDELDDVFGRDGQVCYNDRSKLPYTMATIFEAERWVSINPLYPPRSAIETFEVDGLVIPKGSMLIANSWAIMHDEKHWESAHEFLPERFLSLNDTQTTKFKGYCPFSFGRRNCPGENVAIMTILLFFTSMMQKFTVTTPSGVPVDLTSEFGIVIHAKDQELCFKER